MQNVYELCLRCAAEKWILLLATDEMITSTVNCWFRINAQFQSLLFLSLVLSLQITATKNEKTFVCHLLKWCDDWRRVWEHFDPLEGAMSPDLIKKWFHFAYDYSCLGCFEEVPMLHSYLIPSPLSPPLSLLSCWCRSDLLSLFLP